MKLQFEHLERNVVVAVDRFQAGHSRDLVWNHTSLLEFIKFTAIFLLLFLRIENSVRICVELAKRSYPTYSFRNGAECKSLDNRSAYKIT